MSATILLDDSVENEDHRALELRVSGCDADEAVVSIPYKAMVVVRRHLIDATLRYLAMHDTLLSAILYEPTPWAAAITADDTAAASAIPFLRASCFACEVPYQIGIRPAPAPLPHDTNFALPHHARSTPHAVGPKMASIEGVGDPTLPVAEPVQAAKAAATPKAPKPKVAATPKAPDPKRGVPDAWTGDAHGSADAESPSIQRAANAADYKAVGAAGGEPWLGPMDMGCELHCAGPAQASAVQGALARDLMAMGRIHPLPVCAIVFAYADPFPTSIDRIWRVRVDTVNFTYDDRPRRSAAGLYIAAIRPASANSPSTTLWRIWPGLAAVNAEHVHFNNLADAVSVMRSVPQPTPCPAGGPAGSRCFGLPKARALMRPLAESNLSGLLAWHFRSEPGGSWATAECVSIAQWMALVQPHVQMLGPSEPYERIIMGRIARKVFRDMREGIPRIQTVFAIAARTKTTVVAR